MMDAPSSGHRPGGRLCPKEDYDDDAEDGVDGDDDDDDDEVDEGDDEHDRHNDATDMIAGRRKTTKYFFQK